MSKLSLQEQLLKAGLVNQKKVAKAKKGSKKSRVQAREAKAAVEQQKLEQKEKDIKLNKKRDAEAQSKAVKAQIKQLIDMNKVCLKEGDIKYNFTDGSLIKTLYVDEKTRKQLLNGILSIAKDSGQYVIIPSSVAYKIAQRDEQVIIENKSSSEETLAEDDPYAEFVVPDDLMW